MNKDKPLVSVLIRTCNRIDLLSRAIKSVLEQTYENIQIVVVEDGEACSGETVKRLCEGANYIYKATGSHIGRSAVGNLAMSLADGEFFNFLDDDDRLLENHVEQLIDSLKDTDCLAAYSLAEEVQVTKSKHGKDTEKRKWIRYRQPFNRLLLFHHNYFAIQSVLFSRKLYEEAGGFCTELELLEDWDLWVRYATMTDFVYVDAVTSVYYVAYERGKKKYRGAQFIKAEKAVSRRFDEYKLQMSAGSIKGELDYIISEYNTKRYINYLKKVMRAVLWGER